MKRKNNRVFTLTVSHYKILETVKELNDNNKYPTPRGINNILSGAIDEESRQYAEYKTYGTLISFQGRKLCSYILNMVRHGYLSYIYDEKTDGMYLRLTEKGEEALFTFNKKHKASYRRKTPHKKAEIVEIK